MRTKPKTRAPTAAAQRMREHRSRKAIGAVRIAIDLDGNDVDWLRGQGVLQEWNEADRKELSKALKLALRKLAGLQRNEG
ncbi:hypothetical protein ABIB75_001535 [Bradyrhizobium sp. GM2.2]